MIDAYGQFGSIVDNPMTNTSLVLFALISSDICYFLIMEAEVR